MIREMDERATKEILVIPGIYEPSIVDITPTHRALKRGVRIRRLLRAVSPQNKNIVKENIKLGEEVRQKTLSGLRLNIIDRKEAIISIVDPQSKNRISIYTSNKDFANSVAIFFESLWDKSDKIQVK